MTQPVAVRRLRVRDGRSDGVGARLRTERTLARVELRPRDLPPAAILLVRSLQARVDDAPRVLAEQLRGAARPAYESVPAGANAVLFANRAELLACLAADWCAGVAWGRWWWSLVVRDGLRGPVGAWEDAPEAVPAAFAALAARGLAVEFASRLADGRAWQLASAVARVYGVTATVDVLADRPLPESPASAPPAVHARARARDPAPEATAPGLSRPQRRLLRLALTLRRAPAQLRGPAEGVTAPEPGSPRPGLIHAPSGARPPRSAELGPPIEPTAPPPGERARAPEPTAPVPPTARPAAELSRTPARAPDPPHPPAARTPAPTTAAPAPPPLTGRSPVAATDESPRPTEGRGAASAGESPGPTPVTAHEKPHETPAPRAAELSGTDAAREGGAPAGPAHIDVSPDATSGRQETAQGPTPPLPQHRPVETSLGGLLFLIGVAQRIGLYADFTEPEAPGIALDPWRFVALAGAQLVDVEAHAADALWGLLHELAGDDDRTLRAEELGSHVDSVRAWLELHVELPVQAVLERPALVFVDETRIDAVFPLATHPIELRLAGLDIDPGWIPAAGRALHFHFE